MALAVGTRLGPYEIVALLGAGGMGEVYKATDTRLARAVAIKVLPAHVAGDPQLKQRFEREAKSLAVMSHAHICSVFDVGSEDGVDFLVMEYLEGETLAQRLTKGSVPLAQVLEIAIEIADGLDKAHRKGIVHRDLKPGNIMLTKSGAKLLDFGLAKLRPQSAAGSLSMLTTQESALTTQGTVLGTLQYMAPEQIQGREADPRSDIFSLGAVVYEMATGARAFNGDNSASVAAAVIEREAPSLSATQPMAPRALDRLVKTCLAKDPDDRWQSAGDLMREMKWIVADAHTAPWAPITPRQRSPWSWALGTLAVGALVITGVWALSGSPPREVQPIVRSVIATPEAQPGGGISLVRDLAISPDGSRVVYGPNNLSGPLRLHSFDRLESEPLRGTEGGSSPTFSRDGGSVAFFHQRDFALKRISILGGPVSTIVTTDGLLAGLSWGPDDTMVFATERSEGLLRVPAGGDGKPEQLTTVAKGQGETAHRWPSVLPSGRVVLFTVWRGSIESSRLAVVSLDTRKVTYLTPGSHPLYAPTGHIVYAAGGALRAVGFDPVKLALTSDSPVPVVDAVQVQATGAAQFDLANNGSLVYVPRLSAAAPLRTLVWVDREGREKPSGFEPRAYGQVRVSPDGNRIAAQIYDGVRPDIWISNAARTTWSKLPSPPSSSGFGRWFQWWTPDGHRLVFSNGPGQLVWTPADGTGEVEPLVTIEGSVILAPSGWTPDGRALIFTYGTGSELRIGTLSMEGRGDKKRPWRTLIDRGGKASGPQVSPNGDWVAYQSSDSGKSEVYVERFPNLGDRQTISDQQGGFNPVWSPGGEELFYRRLNDGAMMAVHIRTTPPTIGTPEMLFGDPGTYFLRAGGRVWDVAPDGRFLMAKEAPGVAVSHPDNIVHVQNWFRELQRLVPSK